MAKQHGQLCHPSRRHFRHLPFPGHLEMLCLHPSAMTAVRDRRLGRGRGSPHMLAWRKLVFGDTEGSFLCSWLLGNPCDRALVATRLLSAPSFLDAQRTVRLRRVADKRADRTVLHGIVAHPPEL